jgi:hypothetical protein
MSEANWGWESGGCRRELGLGEGCVREVGGGLEAAHSRGHAPCVLAVGVSRQ